MYILLKRLEQQGYLKELINLGLIPCSVERNKQIYEVFLTQKKRGVKNSQVITNISEDFNMPESSLYRIISKMK